MDYQKHYNLLINRAKNRLLEGYVEKHHIIPKCMNGTNALDNLIALTPEEHYVAHQLLVKIYPDESKLVYAAKMMTVGSFSNNRSNKLYGWLRRKNSENLKGHWIGDKNPNNWNDRSGKNNGMYGVSRFGKKNPFYGKKHSIETITKLKKIANQRNYFQENNPHAKTIIFEDSHGNNHKVIGGFTAFCAEHDLPKSTMLKSLYQQKHPQSGKAAGWKAYKLF